MPTIKQVRTLMAAVPGPSFTEYEEPGFVGFHRRHPDGRMQQAHVFWWGNKEIAAEAGIPAATS